ncbi:mannosyl-glycoprotein endo-beta-N-acetylglucosaminidase/flagellar protein FlgJ [Mucilaginibacter pineti]|uniref:Mannosyl-glycoprotein endo-beta-N-acetylglucosaminidase/flagellar protein FlgJ n=1 Tax=Mucilaginibacter pineti TaxID=1391627 RepID=A0A1G7GLJ7_9SPHI|nr:glucosaminidase domain-containing protein [Mucilaginibacter pineti]SDE88859.1 mannosyl-glycoprotein endo-beta-N-acetylglucosaminidase/flagellar protein FlgJ [Mucilaginibacter pineti]
MLRSVFISKIKDGVIHTCVNTGIFPSVVIAQACLESNNGLSLLSAKYHNYFGIKAGSSWQGQIVNMNTKEYVNHKLIVNKQAFRIYSDIQSCFADHIKLFQTVKVYRTAGIFKCDTAEDQANTLYKAGYATDPAYAKKLIDIISENNLKKYDSL